MAAILGAAIVAGVASYAGAQEQKKATKSSNKANTASQNAAREQLRFFVGKSEGAANKGIKAAEQGFDDAQKSVGTVGQAARARILKRETARLGASDSAAADRGLYNSTRALNSRRAVGAETDLSLASVDEAVANLHSQIFRDRARSLGQLHMARMSLYGQAAGLGTSVELANQHQAGNIGAAYGQAGGSIAALMMMYGQQEE